MWRPPILTPGVPLRARLPTEGWRVPITEIARRHELLPCELEPFSAGETIVWRAGDHVIKLTIPSCLYQIEAEVGCLTAVYGKLSVATPQLRASGEIGGWPYVVMELVAGQPIGEAWPALDRSDRMRLSRRIGAVCRELHSLGTQGFPRDRDDFWLNFGKRLDPQKSKGAPSHLANSLERFVLTGDKLPYDRRVPLHAEFTHQHLLLSSSGGAVDFCGLIDFADATVGPPEYEFAALVEFVLKGERGLLREFLLGYGMSEEALTPRYAEVLLAVALAHRFTTLERILSVAGPPTPASLEELAERLFSVSA